jgi:hypothetical protein
MLLSGACIIQISQCRNHLFLEQAEGYVKALEKSTCPLSTMKEVFEHGARNASAGASGDGSRVLDSSFATPTAACDASGGRFESRNEKFTN